MTEEGKERIAGRLEDLAKAMRAGKIGGVLCVATWGNGEPWGGDEVWTGSEANHPDDARLLMVEAATEYANLIVRLS